MPCGSRATRPVRRLLSYGEPGGLLLIGEQLKLRLAGRTGARPVNLPGMPCRDPHRDLRLQTNRGAVEHKGGALSHQSPNT